MNSSVTRVLINSDGLDDVLHRGDDGDDVVEEEVVGQDIHDKDNRSNNHRHTNMGYMKLLLTMKQSRAV